ncbi:MAG: nucleotidyltransferase family protein [Bacillota bacterium]
MKALILAGGLGTRLRGLINDIPKPMAPVAGRPFLEYLILQLRRHGLTEIVLCIGHLGEQVKRYFGNGDKWGVHILYSYEKEPLGTGGAIKLAGNLIKEENFLVMNGDSFLDVNLNGLIDYHLRRKALATMALVEVEDPTRYGAVKININEEIESFVEKGQSSSRLINSGIYALNRKNFDRIPVGKVSLEKEVFPKLIGKGFYGMPVKGFFIDIGVVEDYRRLQDQRDVLSKIVEGIDPGTDHDR